MFEISLLLLQAVAGDPAPQQQQPQEAVTTEALATAPDENAIICRQVPVTGSRTMTRRVCTSKRDDRLERERVAQVIFENEQRSLPADNSLNGR